MKEFKTSNTLWTVGRLQCVVILNITVCVFLQTNNKTKKPISVQLTCQVWGPGEQCHSCAGIPKPKPSLQSTSWPTQLAELQCSLVRWHNHHLRAQTHKLSAKTRQEPTVHTRRRNEMQITAVNTLFSTVILIGTEMGSAINKCLCWRLQCLSVSESQLCPKIAPKIETAMSAAAARLWNPWPCLTLRIIAPVK